MADDVGEYIEVAGATFWKLRRSQLPFSRVEPGSPDDEYVLLPHYEPDDHMDFPGHPALLDAGWRVRCGIADYPVDRWDGEYAVHKPTGRKLKTTDFTGFIPTGLTATQLGVFDEIDWFGECWQVLVANGWQEGTILPAEFLARVAEFEPEIEAEAKAAAGENWQAYVHERAAKHLTKPFSRVWYAANMMALYYIHHDDMRLGYLWCEYQMKKRYELVALRHLDVVKQNQENGKKGGQADKKRIRYAALDAIASAPKYLAEITFASDREAIRAARRFAAEHDANLVKNGGEPLFNERGHDLSSGWYGDWVADFRAKARAAK